MMPLGHSIFHLLLICAVIAVVIAAIRKEAPRNIALSTLKFFLMTIGVFAGITALLHLLIAIGS